MGFRGEGGGFSFNASGQGLEGDLDVLWLQSWGRGEFGGFGGCGAFGVEAYGLRV